jgi:hypothetical protein
MDLNKKLDIKIKYWDHTCADGCCYDWGKNVYINDEILDMEDYDASAVTMIEEILKYLGYKNVEIEETNED